MHLPVALIAIGQGFGTSKRAQTAALFVFRNGSVYTADAALTLKQIKPLVDACPKENPAPMDKWFQVVNVNTAGFEATAKDIDKLISSRTWIKTVRSAKTGANCSTIRRCSNAKCSRCTRPDIRFTFMPSGIGPCGPP